MAADPDLWMAFYHDWSGVAIFCTEIEARRYAMDGRTMDVAPIQVGKDLKDCASEYWRQGCHATA